MCDILQFPKARSASRFIADCDHGLVPGCEPSPFPKPKPEGVFGKRTPKLPDDYDPRAPLRRLLDILILKYEEHGNPDAAAWLQAAAYQIDNEQGSVA